MQRLGIMVISFSSEKARNYLLETGSIYTLRMNRRTMLGKDWMNEGRTKTKIADVYITEIGHFKLKDLEPYAEESGFGSLRSWINEIVMLNWNRGRFELGDGSMGWLYLVTLREMGATVEENVNK